MSDNQQEEGSNQNGSWMKYEAGAIEDASGSSAGPTTNFVPIQWGENDEAALAGFQQYGGDDGDPDQSASTGEEERASIDDLEQAAYEKGFAQGEKDGYELGEQRGLKVLENIENLLGKMEGLKKEMLRQYEEDILETVFTIAKKVTHVQIGLNDSVVRETILTAIEYVAEKQSLILRINPEDLNFVEKLRPEIFEAHRELTSITVTADRSVSRGGCLLTTPSGDIDARIETQLEKISESIQNAFSGKD